jgi:hypothetical protein
MSSLPTTRTWMTASACVLAAIAVARCARTSPPASGRGPGRALDAQRPHPAPPRPSVTAPGADPSPSLSRAARLHAAMAVMATPPSGPPPPLPPRGPLPAALDGQRRVALRAWQADAQRTLDQCVARPEARRQPVALDVWFAPPPRGGELAPQQLAPVTISLAAPELERLWLDTDPDALQACLDRVRAQVLSVPATRDTPERALPAAAESVLVTL